MAHEAVSGKGERKEMTTHYRIFIANSGLFCDSANYSFVAEFENQKLAAFYVQHMRSKKRYDGKDIIVKEVGSPEIDPAEGSVSGVVAETGEALPVDEYEFV